MHNIYIYIYKVMWSRYRPGVAHTMGRGIALLFHDRGTRRGWVVSSTPRPHFTPGKDPVPIVQEAGWAPGPVWTGGKSRPHRDSITDRPALSSDAIPAEPPCPYIYSTRSPIVTLLYRRAQSDRWSSFCKLLWFTEWLTQHLVTQLLI